MKLATTSTSPIGEPGFDYTQELTCDYIKGTKEQIQRIGVAVGMAFPGEPDGPKRQLKTTDHRGFAVSIREWYDEGVYAAWIHFPNREGYPDSCWTDFAPGVRSRKAPWGDEYEGSAMALVNAGLVQFDQLPGQPGMRKTTVTIYPDGTLPSGPKSVSREPGAKRITRASKNAYNLHVYIDTEEREQREAERQRVLWEWEARMRNLPRPAPLVDLGGDAIQPAKMKPAPKYRVEGNVIHFPDRDAAARRGRGSGEDASILRLC